MIRIWLLVLPLGLFAETPDARILIPGSDFAYVRGQEVLLRGFSVEEGLHYTWQVSTGEELEGESATFILNSTEPVTVSMTAINANGEASVPDNRILYPFNAFQAASLPRVVQLIPSRSAVRPNMPFTIDAEIQDPEQDGPFEYHWFWLENDRPKRAVGENAEFRLPKPDFDGQAVLIYLTAIDQAGNASFPYPTPVYVSEGNLPPTSRIVEPASVEVNVFTGTEVVFRAEGEDIENDLPLSYRWIFPDGSIRTENPATFSFDEPGLFAVVLNATDSLGNTDPLGRSVRVKVHDPGSVEVPLTGIFYPLLSTRIFEGDSLILAGFTQDGVASRWRVTDIATGQVTAEVAGAQPGRLTFPDAGLFRLLFQAEVLGQVTPPGYGNTRWISVQKQDENRAPVLDYADTFRHVVRNGETLDLSVEVSDPDGDGVRLFWVADGVLLGEGGPDREIRFDLEDGEFYQGSVLKVVETLALDARGKAPSRPLYHSVLVYQERFPPTPTVNGLPTGTTVFVPVGDNYPLEGLVEDAEGLSLNHRWTASYSGEIFNFFESNEAQPGAITLPKTGIVFLQYSVETTDTELRGSQIHILYLHVYDPETPPLATITKPNTDRVRTEPGIPITVEGLAFDPNVQPSPYEELTIFEPLTHDLIWELEHPDGTAQQYIQNDALTLTLTEPGNYALRLLAKNSLGLVTRQPDEIAVEVAAPKTDDFYEPNNTRGTAADIQNGNYGGLSVGADDPVDWYTFELTEPGSTVEMNLDLLGATAPVDIAVYSGDTRVYEARLASGKRHPFTFAGGNAGTYYLELRTEPGTLSKDGPGFALSLSVLTPRLTFPYPKNDEVDQTFLTLLNPFGEEAEITLAARDSTGNTLAETNMVLPANGHSESAVSDLFAGTDSLEIAWVQVASTKNILGLATTLARDEQTAFTEPALVSGLDELIIPHIAQNTEQWFTRAALANTSGEAVSAVFRSGAGDYQIPQFQAINQSSLLDFEKFFGGTLPSGSEWGRFLETDAKPGLSGLELFGTKQGSPRMAALNLTSEKLNNPNFVYVNRNIYFPHVAADVNNFWTGIAFVNTGQTATDAVLVAYDNAGQVLDRITISMAPNEKRVALAQEFFPDLQQQGQISWIELQTTGAVSGYELFGDNTGQDRLLAGFPAVRGGSRELIFQKILHEQGKYYTGIAVVNLSVTEEAALTYQAFAGDGTVLATEQRSIGPNRKDVALVEAIFGGSLPAGTRWVRLTSSQPLAAFSLMGDTAGNFLAGALAQ